MTWDSKAHTQVAQWQNTTKPVSRDTDSLTLTTSQAQNRARWKRLGTVAQRAGDDDTASDSETAAETPEELARIRERKRRQKKERDKNAKIMGLDYFLEMVDHKHRYGSNLRRYHVEWKKSDTNEHFFYWLDHGEGRELDLEDRPRSRLDSEFVRYLSKEDRQKYLVTIDERGRFCYAKNDQLITTSPHFRDSINGIVPVEDKTPTWREVVCTCPCPCSCPCICIHHGLQPSKRAFSDSSRVSPSGDEHCATLVNEC